MKISIITVVYNNKLTIREAILSVIEQTYEDIEYIIIDGGSTDGTKEILEEYRSNFTVFISEPDNGIYDAMNKGIELAKGDVIGILNSDDLYEDENVIKDVMAHFKSDPSLFILYGNLVYVKNNDVNKTVRNWISKPYYDQFFENGDVPPHPALFVRSTVYKVVGHFNLNYKLAADYEFMLRVFKKNIFKSKYINRLIVRMRLGGATNKNLKNIFNGNNEIIKAWENNKFKPPFYLMAIRLYKRLKQFI